MRKYICILLIIILCSFLIGCSAEQGLLNGNQTYESNEDTSSEFDTHYKSEYDSENVQREDQKDNSSPQVDSSSENEHYNLTDILMIKITKNYALTCSSEFNMGDSVPYQEIFRYFMLDGCYTFDERTIAESVREFYDKDTLTFAVPCEVADEYLTQRFNTVADPQSVKYYDPASECYIFSREIGEYYYDLKVVSKNKIDNNVFDFSVELTSSIAPTSAPRYCYSFTVELNKNGHKILAVHISEN